MHQLCLWVEKNARIKIRLGLPALIAFPSTKIASSSWKHRKPCEAAVDCGWGWTTSCFKRRAETFVTLLASFLCFRSPRDRISVGSEARVSDTSSHICSVKREVLPYSTSPEHRTLRHVEQALYNMSIIWNTTVAEYTISSYSMHTVSPVLNSIQFMGIHPRA